MNAPPSSSIGQYFSSPYFPSRQPGIQDLYDNRKRKRKSTELVEEDGGDANLTQDQSPSNPGYSSQAALPPDLARQYRPAGQPFDKEPPGGDFPHKPDTDRVRLLKPSKVAEELANLNPPLQHSTATSFEHSQTSEKQKQVAVLTAIMHTCMLNGDYLRAGRAWGMLLRTELRGRQLDVRLSGLWGLGAELLIRQGNRIGTCDSHITSHQHDDEGSPTMVDNQTSVYFSPEGVENAKLYFEHLITHFQPRKGNYSIQRLWVIDFYKAMFGLWISSVQDQHEQALEKLRYSADDSDQSNLSDEKEDEDESDFKSSHERERQLENIRLSVLDLAEAISHRFDETIVSPPFSEDSTLLNLRAMLSLWIADLSIAGGPRSDWIDREENGSDDVHEGENDQIGQQMSKRQEHLQKAEQMFARAKDKSLGRQLSP